MILKRVVRTMSDICQFMQDCIVPSILKRVEYDDSSKILTGYDDDDNVVLTIRGIRDSSDMAYFRMYQNESTYIAVPMNVFPAENHDDQYMIGCRNGCMYVGLGVDTTGYVRNFNFIITKTNNDKVAAIFSQITSNTGTLLTSQINHSAYGDDTSFTSTTNFTPEVGHQTILNVFGTNPNLGMSSITPNAFYISCDVSSYNIVARTFTLNGEEYITNGYWAIRVEKEE